MIRTTSWIAYPWGLHAEDHHTPLTPCVLPRVGTMGTDGICWSMGNVWKWEAMGFIMEYFFFGGYHVTKRDFHNRQVNEVMRYINSDGLHSHKSRGFGFSRDCCRLNFDGINDPPRYQLVMGNMAKPCETNCWGNPIWRNTNSLCNCTQWCLMFGETSLPNRIP